MNDNKFSSDQLLEILQKGLNEAEKALIITNYEPLDEPDPKIIYINDVFTKITGFSEHETLGRSPRMHHGPETDPEEKKRIKALLKKNEKVSSNLINYRKDGTTYWTNIQISPASCGNNSYWVGLKRDITAEKERELELLKNNTRLQSEILTVRKMISLMAHDLRSPLSGITGGLQYLSEYKSQVTSDERDSFIEVMISSSNSIGNMLDSVLDWAVLQGDKIDFNPEEFCLSSVVQSIIDIYKISASLKKVTIINNVSSGFMMLADRDMIHSIIRNLVSNSMKYTTEGGTISISVEKDPVCCVISVSDTGTGISGLNKTIHLDEETIESMNVNKRKGLGLVLCRDFVKYHNGSMTVTSRPDSGTTVSIHLPRDIEVSKDTGH